MQKTPILLQKLFPEIQWKSPNSELLLTFDDGPDTLFTPKFSALATEHNKKAIFFVVGDRCKDTALLKDCISSGHEIGWHSQTHRSFWKLSKTEINQELESFKVIEDQLGEKINFFRFPYGHFLPSHIRQVKALNLTPMLWSAMVSDYKDVSRKTLDNRLKKLTSSDILLYHDSSPNTKNAYAALASYLDSIRQTRK
jgi:peptidoglycan/xylan/chitin deacetylase (PgdA/CDA1 family)